MVLPDAALRVHVGPSPLHLLLPALDLGLPTACGAGRGQGSGWICQCPQCPRSSSGRARRLPLPTLADSGPQAQQQRQPTWGCHDGSWTILCLPSALMCQSFSRWTGEQASRLRWSLVLPSSAAASLAWLTGLSAVQENHTPTRAGTPPHTQHTHATTHAGAGPGGWGGGDQRETTFDPHPHLDHHSKWRRRTQMCCGRGRAWARVGPDMLRAGLRPFVTRVQESPPPPPPSPSGSELGPRSPCFRRNRTPACCCPKRRTASWAQRVGGS
jgi:hypothetical protein